VAIEEIFTGNFDRHDIKKRGMVISYSVFYQEKHRPTIRRKGHHTGQARE
jgi:hypothetical protein